MKRKTAAKKEPAPDGAKEINVEMPGPLRRRLKLYVAQSDSTIKAVVNAAVDEYLKKQGA